MRGPKRIKKVVKVRIRVEGRQRQISENQMSLREGAQDEPRV